MSASKQQSVGIDEMNNAVAQLNIVTQGNAANAEQTASSSVDLSEQAGELSMIVDVLKKIVGASSQMGNKAFFSHKGTSNHDNEMNLPLLS
jgi:methyl-accepting chemotaxis protein